MTAAAVAVRTKRLLQLARATCGMAAWALVASVLPRDAWAQRVVRETAVQWNAARALILTVQRRWCTDVEDAGCDFKSIAQVFAMPDQGVLVADVMGPLRRFAADGRFVGALARKGQGPGEYGFVVTPHLHDGRVWWFDNTQMRLASIGLDNVPGPVVRLMPPATMANIFVVAGKLVVLDVPALATLGDTVVASYRTVPTSGAPRVLARVRTPSQFEPGSTMLPMKGPFDARIVSDVGLGGDVAHSNGARYDVLVFPAVGSPWRLEIDAPARRVMRVDRDSAIARVLRAFRAARLNDLVPTVRRGYETMPTTMPPLQTIRVVRDGTVYLRLATNVNDARARWDVFSRDGRRMGRVALPARASIKDGTSDWIIVVEPGEDDVPQIVRYGVSR